MSRALNDFKEQIKHKTGQQFFQPGGLFQNYKSHITAYRRCTSHSEIIQIHPRNDGIPPKLGRNTSRPVCSSIIFPISQPKQNQAHRSACE